MERGGVETQSIDICGNRYPIDIVGSGREDHISQVCRNLESPFDCCPELDPKIFEWILRFIWFFVVWSLFMERRQRPPHLIFELENLTVQVVERNFDFG